MNEYNQNPFPIEDHHALAAKWLKLLLYVCLASIGCSLLNLIPILSVVAGWGSTAVSVALVYVLFQLAPSNARYRKAAIFRCVVLVAGLLAENLLSLVISVCSIVAMYQEYMGHSEITASRAPALSDKWHSLFNIQLIVGVLSAVTSSAGVMIGVLAGMGSDALVGIIVFVMSVIGIGLNLLYLHYLNQTVKLYEE